MLIRGRDVDLRELDRQQPREVHVVALDDPERARLAMEARQQHVAKHCGIAVGRQPDDLAFVPARLEAEPGRHRLVERAERVRVLDAVHALDALRRGRSLTLPARPMPYPSSVTISASSKPLV